MVEQQQATLTNPAMSGDITETNPDWFEAVYAAAGGDIDQIPWNHKQAHPALINWLNAVAPSLIRSGSRVAVVGCGLGSDARELIRRGYDVTAFDVSKTAIDWAQQIDPDHAACFHHTDLFEFPSCWRHRFELVVEIHTVQALPPSQRVRTLSAIGELIAPHSYGLVIARAATEPAPLDVGPPWPLTSDELLEAVNSAGLVADQAPTVFEDDQGTLRLRSLIRHA